MNKHPYLRAYLAGIAFPTVFLMVIMTGYTIVRYVCIVPIPIERLIVFPMAVVPNAWGLWNVIYRASGVNRHVSLGIFGGALPPLLAPCGYAVARLFDVPIPHAFLTVFSVGFPVALILYYLVWKHLVGFLNAELGIA
jgi:hypothetical protein